MIGDLALSAPVGCLFPYEFINIVISGTNEVFGVLFLAMVVLISALVHLSEVYISALYFKIATHTYV